MSTLRSDGTLPDQLTQRFLPFPPKVRSFPRNLFYSSFTSHAHEAHLCKSFISPSIVGALSVFSLAAWILFFFTTDVELVIPFEYPSFSDFEFTLRLIERFVVLPLPILLFVGSIVVFIVNRPTLCSCVPQLSPRTLVRIYDIYEIIFYATMCGYCTVTSIQPLHNTNIDRLFYPTPVLSVMLSGLGGFIRLQPIGIFLLSAFPPLFRIIIASTFAGRWELIGRHAISWFGCLLVGTVIGLVKAKLIEKRMRVLYFERWELDLARIRVEEAVEGTVESLENVLPKVYVSKIQSVFSASSLAVTTVGLAQYFDDLVAIQSDFVHFTPLASSLDSHQLIAILNTYYRSFDSLAKGLRIEKLKNAGDSFLGIDLEHANHHQKKKKKKSSKSPSLRSVELALRFLQATSKVNAQLPVTLQIRVGVARGSGVVGTIGGTTSLTCDAWGPVVASVEALEQSCPRDSVQIDRSIAEESSSWIEDDSCCEWEVADGVHCFWEESSCCIGENSNGEEEENESHGRRKRTLVLRCCGEMNSLRERRRRSISGSSSGDDNDELEGWVSFEREDKEDKDKEKQEELSMVDVRDARRKSQKILLNKEKEDLEIEQKKKKKKKKEKITALRAFFSLQSPLFLEGLVDGLEWLVFAQTALSSVIYILHPTLMILNQVSLYSLPATILAYVIAAISVISVTVVGYATVCLSSSSSLRRWILFVGSILNGCIIPPILLFSILDPGLKEFILDHHSFDNYVAIAMILMMFAFFAIPFIVQLVLCLGVFILFFGLLSFFVGFLFLVPLFALVVIVVTGGASFNLQLALLRSSEARVRLADELSVVQKQHELNDGLLRSFLPDFVIKRLIELNPDEEEEGFEEEDQESISVVSEASTILSSVARATNRRKRIRIRRELYPKISTQVPNGCIGFVKIQIGLEWDQVEESKKERSLALVEFLMNAFQAFDSAISRFETVSRVKTVNSTFVFISQQQQQQEFEDSVRHRREIAECALLMREAFLQIEEESFDLSAKFTCGLHQGAFSQGVTGFTRVSYDVFGASINAASRLSGLEDNSIRVCSHWIECSEDFVDSQSEALTLEHWFDFGELRTEMIKGRGEMLTRELVGRKK